MLDFQVKSFSIYQFEAVDYLEKRKENKKTVQSHVLSMISEKIKEG